MRRLYSGKRVYLCCQLVHLRRVQAELTKLINRWVNDSKLKNNVSKVIHVMSSLLLLKPSKTSKSKDHIKAIQPRLDSWKSGDNKDLIFEAATI